VAAILAVIRNQKRGRNMKKLSIFAAAGVAAAALMATSANAASMLFQFDADHSNITVTQNNTHCIGNCAVTASLTTPFDDLTIDEGTSQSFDFAKFRIGRGLGWGDATIEATLAFITPDVDPATSTGNANYFTIFGALDGGNLVWSSISPITTSDGSIFSVAFNNLYGLTPGSHVTDGVTISVDHVGDQTPAVPEPATWGLFLAGFGLCGQALRRRKQAQAYA
jgi:hypothetical protein